MEVAYNIYSIAMIVWYVISLLMVLYVYEKCIKRYRSKNEKKEYEKNPKEISCNELSYLMYKKMIPEVITASIINLIEKKHIVIEEEKGIYYISETLTSTSKLSDSDKFLLEMINRMIDGKKRISIDQIASYSDNSKNASDFMMNYEIYRKMLRNESKNVPYFESKLIYTTLAAYKDVSMVLFLAAIAFSFFKHYNYLGYLIILVSYLINELFLKSYKRTKEANDLYYDYLAYKKYLENIDTLGYDDKKVNYYMATGLILKVNGLCSRLKQDEVIDKLNSAINRCVAKAIEKR